MVTAHPADYTRPATPEARLEAFEARSAFRVALREIVGDADGWRDADARTRALLWDTPDVPAFAKEQTAATSMLTAFPLTGERARSEDQTEAIGVYTEMLVRHHNPNADLIDRALTALEGSWSEAQIARAAEAGYAAAETYIQTQTDCEGCRIAEAVPSSPAARRRPEVTGIIQQAVDGAERLGRRF